MSYVEGRSELTSKLVIQKVAVMRHLEGEWINEGQCKGNLNGENKLLDSLLNSCIMFKLILFDMIRYKAAGSGGITVTST